MTASGRRVATSIVAGAIAGPVVVLLVRLLAGPSWVSFGDWAAIELRTRDVGTAYTPLVGPYSRYGWSHPGPLLFYVLALPYRSLGGAGTALLVGATVVNALAVTGIAVTAYRRGGATGMLVVCAVALLLVRALGVDFLHDPWNPRIVVLPLFAAVTFAWSAADGDRWAPPLAVAFASFAVQSHVGVTIAAAATLTTAALPVRRDRRALGLAFIVGLVLWLPPIVDGLTADGGNLAAVVRFWRESDAPITGWAAGARLVALELTVPAPWLTGDSERNPFTGGVHPGWHVPWVLALLLAALALALRRRDRQSALLGGMALAFVVAAWVSASRIFDIPFEYIVQWLWVVGAITWIAILWSGWRALGSSWFGSVVPVLAGIGVVVLGVLLTVTAARTTLAIWTLDEPMRALETLLRPILGTLPQPILVLQPDARSADVALGIVTIGARMGVDVRGGPVLALQMGAHRTTGTARAGSVLDVAVDAAAARYTAAPATYRRIAVCDPPPGGGPRVEVFLETGTRPR